MLDTQRQPLRQYLQDLLNFFLRCHVHHAFVLLEIQLKLLGQLNAEIELWVKVADLPVYLLGSFVGACDLAELAGHVSQHVGEQGDTEEHY